MKLMVPPPRLVPDVADLLGVVAHCLEQRGMANAEELAARCATSWDRLQAALDILVQAGTIEALSPIGTSTPRLVYYRWRRTTDRQYLWQTAVRPRLPHAPRLFSLPLPA